MNEIRYETNVLYKKNSVLYQRAISHTHTHTNACTHACTHAHTHKHTHTHHTHSPHAQAQKHRHTQR